MTRFLTFWADFEVLNCRTEYYYWNFNFFKVKNWIEIINSKKNTFHMIYIGMTRKCKNELMKMNFTKSSVDIEKAILCHRDQLFSLQSHNLAVRNLKFENLMLQPICWGTMPWLWECTKPWGRYWRRYGLDESKSSWTPGTCGFFSG